MSRSNLKEEISRLLIPKKDKSVIVRYGTDTFRIDREGIRPTDQAQDIEDFSGRCDDREHFQCLCRHILARIQGDKDSPDYGFASLSEVKNEGDRCVRGGTLVVYYESAV